MDTLKSPPGGSWSPAVSLPSLLLSIRSLLASPNPDDGLVPEISELYKRNIKKWEEEARKRTEREATVAKLEEAERGLDGDNINDEKRDVEKSNAEEEKKEDDGLANKRSNESNAEENVDAEDGVKRTKR